ncbi:DUF3429 domain-containing protein [Aureimonas ureilytica]|uniref:DUF3429 domain-containing protein n=1 Tax=Aureimonas ureilytica TaxID=401562 RepID=UPI000367CC98|nr:DUF3429 domain-containing protein [Aureimonas ureilytica]
MRERASDTIAIPVREPVRPPLIDDLLAYAAIVPITAGALALVFWPGAPAILLPLTLIWAGAIVTFLSGVRRGVSFRMPDGATLAQLAMMLWLFLAGLGSILLTGAQAVGAATLLLLAAYVSLAVLDPIAARRGEVPNYFAQLRPFQMGLAVLSLALIGLRVGGFV